MNLHLLFLIGLIMGLLPGIGFSHEIDASFANNSLSELEARSTKAKRKLSQLAKTSLSSGVGSIGFATKATRDPNASAWVEIDLGKPTEIDAIVIVPTIRRDAELGLISDGFPQSFQIFAGTSLDTNAQMIADIQGTQNPDLSILPLTIPVDSLEASTIRIEVSRLSRARLWPDGVSLAFLLAEILVFSGEENKALRRPVTASSSLEGINWSSSFLVDGNLPYQMDAATGERSQTMAINVDRHIENSVTIDLGKTTPISRLRIHTEDPADMVPRDYLENNGIPEHFHLYGSDHPDFLEQEELLRVDLSSFTQIAPIMEWAFPEKACRYVRLSTDAEQASGETSPLPKRISFAEIEILSHGKNVAINQAISASFSDDREISKLSPLSHIVDGRNEFGDILPMRKWLAELARRRQLEREIPLLEAELGVRYDKQRRLLNWAKGLLLTSIIAISFLLLYMRMQRQRQETLIRQRIASNLHDELGANLHAIGLLGDVAEESVHSPDRLIESVRRIRVLTERTGAAARHCANMLEAENICENLVKEIRKDAERFLSDLHHDLQIHDEEKLNQLPRRKRIDLYLFYRECLVNIVRHARARKVTTILASNNLQTELIVTDDGCGHTGPPPSSLMRRARLMGAKLEVQQPQSEGTRIQLTMKHTKSRQLK